MKRFFALLLIVAALFAALPACADAPLPPVLQKLKDDGATLDFMGHQYGVDAWRIVPKGGGDAKYAYTTPEGGIMLGILLKPDGTSALKGPLEALKGKMEGEQAAMPGAEKSPAASVKAEKMYAEVESAAWARTGDAKAPYLYLFVNTLCDHCQKMWQALEPSVKTGKLQVRLVPFGKVEQNRLTGAALLSVDDPAAAWDDFINGNAAALSANRIKPGALAKLDLNTTLFRDWAMQGPPFTVYRRPADGQITVVAGEPDNILLVLADLMKKGQGG